jgi:HlyD family secretion protein
MKKSVTSIISFILVAGIALAGCSAIGGITNRTGGTPSASNYQIVQLKKSDLSQVVGATGTVRANQSATLTWQTSGTVEKLNVAIGDKVQTGQVLATLQKTSLAQNIVLAQADLISAQQALKDLYDTQLAQAQTEQNVANAQKAIDTAQSNFDSVQTPGSTPDINAAKANLLLAKNALDKAQKDYDPYANKVDTNLFKAMLLNKLASAQKRYDSAVNTYNNLIGTANKTTVSVSQANLDLAKAQLVDAQKKLADLKAGPSANDIASAQARIDAAQATLNQAFITAPFDGLITDSMNQPGDQVRTGTQAFQLDDPSQMLVDVQISELDIDKVKTGQDAVLTFDGLPGKTYHGQVIEVGQNGVSNSGVVDFPVTVQITDADASIKPGMTAAVNITVSNLAGVLAVPSRAIRNENGQRVVYTLQEGKPQPVQVEIGASSDTMTQILSGSVKEGDQIVLNPPTQLFTPGGGRPGGGSGGGMFGGGNGGN